MGGDYVVVNAKQKEFVDNREGSWGIVAKVIPGRGRGAHNFPSEGWLLESSIPLPKKLICLVGGEKNYMYPYPRNTPMA